MLNSYVFDAWTPGGMLGVGLTSVEDMINKSIKGDDIQYTTNGILINGNLWDDWYVQILPEDYDYHTNNPFK